MLWKKNIPMLAFVAGSMLFMVFSVYFYQIFYSPNLAVRQEKAYVYIPEKATVHSVLDTLLRHKYLEDVVSFMFVSKLLGYHGHVKPGFYVLPKRTNNLSAVRLLRSGAQTPLDVTLSQVRTKEDIAVRLCRRLALPDTALLSLMNDGEFLAPYGFDTASVASMFIPNTYEVYYTVTAKGLFERMYREYGRFWNAERLRKAEALGLSPRQVSVLASIVQAETLKEDEKPRVAGLYVNRLRRGIRLSADPTVVFALRAFGLRRVLQKHLAVDSPYNTYRHAGLPPGPINTPEPASIDAVLDYERHNYLYMCAREDFSGYHRFASRLSRHNANAQKYRRALNRRGIR